jgi:PAS domain S-box-containing protein
MTSVARPAATAAAHSGFDATSARGVAIAAAVIAAYVVFARLGFAVAFVDERVTTVWAPTGISIATLLLLGLRFSPAIWLGALIANSGPDGPFWMAPAIATGNTLEAVAATWALRRLRIDVSLCRIVDVLALTAIGAGLAPMVSATIGAIALGAAGVQRWDLFATLWFDWWLGDALGALVVAPAILTTMRTAWSRRTSLTVLGFVASSLLVTHLIFGQVFGFTAHPLEFVVFPIVIAAAVMGGPPATALAVLSVAAVTIWHTVHGAGPFAGEEVHASLILLQTFTGVLGSTGLLLAAAIAERERSEQREKHAAAVVRQREEMLRLAQHAGGVATYEWDFANQLARCSPEFFAIFGLPAREGEMSAAEWGGFVHPDDRAAMALHLERAIAGQETPAADYRIVRGDGSVRWLSYAGQIQNTPAGDRLMGTVIDITDRKRLEEELRHHAAEAERMLAAQVGAEAALRESRDVLSLAMRGGSMGAWSRNLVTNEVWWSRELEEIVGLPPGSFAGTEDGFFELVHEEDRAHVRRAVDTAVERRTDYTVEFRFRHASGEWRWMEGRGRAVYGGDGRPRTLYGIAVDVTARKHAAQALEHAKNAAESANQLKDQFLATLSHELRTPLNAILGYARMLQTNAIAPEKRQRAIDVIERNAVAQNRLVEDLLDMSRITTGKVRLNPEPIPVATVLQEAVEGVKPAAEAKRIALELDVDPFAGTVTADATRLQQVFWNLLTNAVKFTGSGGRVVAALRHDGGHVEVVIADTGIGISPEFLPFVFEPFRQADGRLGRGHGGLGLGLAIARQLIELHGGTIQVTSAGVEQGATFTVRLPRLGGAEGPLDVNVAAPTRSEAASLEGLEVLLVDDEEDTLSMFRDALEIAGARVRSARTATEALAIAGTWRPDLIVADLGLPGMDGVELLRAIRASERNRTVPAVAVTAYARLDDRARALSAGFQAHVSKPVDPAALLRVLATAATAIS